MKRLTSNIEGLSARQLAQRCIGAEELSNGRERKLALGDDILMSVSSPARYVGGEVNSVMKTLTPGMVRFAMCFPDVYEIGMSHLGIQILYDMFNRYDDVWCERVYSPWLDLDKIMREKKIPLFALESQEPVKNFDFLGITLQYEMCYTNVLQVLDLSGIPLLAKDRTEEDPIVIGGGPCSYNPEPIAEFFDLFYIGEGETAYRKLLDVYKEVKESGENQPGTLFLISDFQKKNCDFQHITTDSTLESVFLMMKPENRSNLYIKEVNFGQAFHKQNQSETVYITLVNTSDRDFHHIPLTLTINGKKRSIIQTDLEAHSEKKVEISYLNTAEDFYKGTVEISDFPVLFDNTFYFAYPVSENTEILYLWQQEENPYFGKLFSDSSHFSFTSIPVNQAVRQNLPRYSLIILDGLTDSSTGLESMWEDYLMNGGNLLVLPASSSPEVQNKFLQKIQAPRYDKRDTNTVIAHIETQAALFRDAFEQPDIKTILPQIRQYYRLILPAHTEILLSDKHSAPLLVSRHYGKGNLYLSAFNFLPTDSDLVFHPLFVPLLVNMAFQVNTGLHTSYFLNTTAPVLLNTRTIQTNQPLQIRNENHTFEFIPEVRKNFSGDLQLTNATTIQEAGLFEVYQEDRLVDVLAWNYDRTESQMEFCKEQELSQYFPRSKVPDIKTTCFDHNSELVKEIVLQDNNKYLTGWFILIAVSALLLEQLVWRKKLN
mgnify:CR=1 FL=1